MKVVARFFLFFLCFFASLGVSAEVSLIRLEAWPQNKVIQAKIRSYSYASPFNKASQEQRFLVSVNWDASKKLGFHHKLKTNIWGLVPREAADFLDLREAYVGYQTKEWSLKAGRINPSWGSVELYSPIHEIFPSFSLDPMTVNREGIFGFYSSLQRKKFQFETILSPLFVPVLGGPRLSEPGKQLEVLSRWMPPLQYEAIVGEGVFPVDYALHLPDVGEVLAQFGGVFRVSYKNKNLGLALMLADVVDPDPVVNIEENISTVPGFIAELTPEFFRQRVLGFESSLSFSSLKFFAESAYIAPQSSDSRFSKSMLGFHLKSVNFLVPEVVFGSAYKFYIDKKPAFNEMLPSKSDLTLFSKLGWSPFSWISLILKTESDPSFTEGFVSAEVSLNFIKKSRVTVGADVIFGEDNSFWGKFRAYDRFWVQGSYAF